jgi:hypothetical protein
MQQAWQELILEEDIPIGFYPEKSTINTTASVNSGSDFSESNFYWSSTMNNYNSAWSQVFNTGGQTGNLKTYLTHYVRAVRAF